MTSVGKYRIIKNGYVARIISYEDAVKQLKDNNQRTDFLYNPVYCFYDEDYDVFEVVLKELETLFDSDEVANTNELVVEVEADEIFECRDIIERDITEQMLTALKSDVGVYGEDTYGTREIMWQVWCDLKGLNFDTGNITDEQIASINIDELVKYFTM